MAFPFDIQGVATVGIDEPAKAQRVLDGVEHWLVKARARDLRWEKGCLHFRGLSAWPLRWNGMSPLQGFGRNEIRFQKSADQVVMHFTMALSQIALWAPLVLLLIVGTLGRFPIWICLLVVPAFVTFNYLASLGWRPVFRSRLELAAIRGQADGAAEELAQLQSKSAKESGSSQRRGALLD